MNLDESVASYVRWKQSTDLSFDAAEKTYRAFLKSAGNLPLDQINVDHVLRFLNRAQTSVLAFRKKHSLLRHVFEYWAAHGAVTTLPMPANLPRPARILCPASTQHHSPTWGDLKAHLGGGDHTLLETAEQGEDAAKKAYKDALEKMLPSPVKQLLTTQYAHIQKSHDYVKAARDSSK